MIQMDTFCHRHLQRLPETATTLEAVAKESGGGVDKNGDDHRRARDPRSRLQAIGYSSKAQDAR